MWISPTKQAHQIASPTHTPTLMCKTQPMPPHPPPPPPSGGTGTPCTLDTSLSTQVNTNPPPGMVNPRTQNTGLSSQVHTASLDQGPHRTHEPAIFSTVCSSFPACHSHDTSDIVKTAISLPTPLVNVLQTTATPSHTSLCNNANIAAQLHPDVSVVLPHHSHPAQLV